MKEDRNEARPRVCGVGGERARLREACANIVEYARSAQCHTEDAHVLDCLNQIEGWAKAALAEPVKNCEVGTVAEQDERYVRYCKKHRASACNPACPLYKQRMSNVLCSLIWAQMPYEEGEKKGDAK